MSQNIIRLSDFIIGNPQVSTFQDLLKVIANQEKHGMILLQIDLKPDYPDTPRNWQDRVESTFQWGM